MRALRRFLPAAALLAACDSLPPAPSSQQQEATAPGSAATTTRTPPSSAPLVPVPSPPRPPSATATVVEVEVSGRVVVPRDAPQGQFLVALTDGPCFQPGTHYLAWARPGATGTYVLQAFPPAGTLLEACGAIVEPQRRGVAWWGRADRGVMPVQGRGRMVYRDTDVPLRRGPEVPLPVGLDLAR